jgi:hypothetical protein
MYMFLTSSTAFSPLYGEIIRDKTPTGPNVMSFDLMRDQSLLMDGRILYKGSLFLQDHQIKYSSQVKKYKKGIKTSNRNDERRENLNKGQKLIGIG